MELAAASPEDPESLAKELGFVLRAGGSHRRLWSREQHSQAGNSPVDDQEEHEADDPVHLFAVEERRADDIRQVGGGDQGNPAGQEIERQRGHGRQVNGDRPAVDRETGYEFPDLLPELAQFPLLRENEGEIQRADGEEERVSSSYIRKMIQKGFFNTTKELLARPFQIDIEQIKEQGYSTQIFPPDGFYSCTDENEKSVRVQIQNHQLVAIPDCKYITILL